MAESMRALGDYCCASLPAGIHNSSEITGAVVGNGLDEETVVARF